MDKVAAIWGYLAFAIYAAIRLGWIAPASSQSVARSMGPCRNIEAGMIIAALAALPMIIWSAT